MANYASIQFDSEGNEAAPVSNIVNPDAIPAMTYGDTSTRRASLDVERDPERALRQAEVDELHRRTRAAEDHALALIDPATGQPRSGTTVDFTRRMSVAQSLREAAQFALQRGNSVLKTRGFDAPAPALGELQAEYDAQQAAADARAAAAITKRAAR